MAADDRRFDARVRMPRDLGGGLVLRLARRSDADELAEFSGAMQAEDDLPPEEIAEWTRELFEVPPPSFRAEDDITVVEDTATGRIVSTMCLFPQVWSYDGLPVAMGQPELVATHPDYRRRGLVREQFEVIHDRSDAAGHLWQLISGIPWYYRQFGYSYALDLPPPMVWRRSKRASTADGFSLRAATTDDIAFLSRVEATGAGRPGLGCLRGTDGWHYELNRFPGALPVGHVLVIERKNDGAAPAEPIGFIVHDTRLRDANVSVWAFGLETGESWLGPTAASLTHLTEWGRSRPDGEGSGVRLLLPRGHPALVCAATGLGRGRPGTHGFYVRIRDLVAFVVAVTGVLEARLAASPVVGHTGELRLDLYTELLRLRFERGRLVAVDRDVPLAGEERADASMSREAFLHLLLGNRALGDIEATFADCRIGTDAGAALLEVLFPRLDLSVWTLG